MPSCFISSYLPYPASLTPFAIRWLPSSIPVPASAMLLPTAFPALPVAPSMVSPRPRLAAPTTPPTRLVKPPTVLPMVEVTNLTPAVTPESCSPIGIAVFCCCFFLFWPSKGLGQLFALSRIVRPWRSRERRPQSLFILFHGRPGSRLTSSHCPNRWQRLRNRKFPRKRPQQVSSQSSRIRAFCRSYSS
jgi:hypothetical protein